MHCWAQGQGGYEARGAWGMQGPGLPSAPVCGKEEAERKGWPLAVSSRPGRRRRGGRKPGSKLCGPITLPPLSHGNT